MPAVAGASTCAPPAAPTLGIGVLGCADIALRRFLPAVVQSERSRLVAIASRDVNKASAVAHRFACAAADYMELLRSDQVDLIYLPLPNHLHEEWAIKALASRGQPGVYTLLLKHYNNEPDEFCREAIIRALARVTSTPEIQAFETTTGVCFKL